MLSGLHEIAQEIYPSSKSITQVKTGIVFANFRSQEKYKVVESFVIKSAIALYREKKPVLFRTVILSEEQLKKTNYPATTFWGDKSGYIMGSTSYIQSSFSWQTRLKLFVCRTYYFRQ